MFQSCPMLYCACSYCDDENTIDRSVLLCTVSLNTLLIGRNFNNESFDRLITNIHSCVRSPCCSCWDPNDCTKTSVCSIRLLSLWLISTFFNDCVLTEHLNRGRLLEDELGETTLGKRWCHISKGLYAPVLCSWANQLNSFTPQTLQRCCVDIVLFHY